MALEALFMLLATAASTQAGQAPAQNPAPSPTPSPSPAFRLLPYWYESPRTPSDAPLLRFEDQAEVRALEMNAAIARFFDPRDENGNMRRGATPGGAPTLDEMREYRPHVSPAADLLGFASWAVRGLKEGFGGIRKTRVERNEELLRALLLASARPSPTASPSPTAAPSPTPQPPPPGSR